MNIDINIYTFSELHKFYEHSSRKCLELSSFERATIILNEKRNKQNVNFSNGCCYRWKYPVLFGNCSNINQIVKTINHEINHLIINKVMENWCDDSYIYKSDGIERITRIMSRQSNRIYSKITNIMDKLRWFH